MIFASFCYLLQGKYLVKARYKREGNVLHYVFSYWIHAPSLISSVAFLLFGVVICFSFKQRFGNRYFSIYLTFGHLELSRALVTHISCVKWSNVGSRDQIQLWSKHSGISKVTSGLVWIFLVAVCCVDYWDLVSWFLSSEGGWCEDAWGAWGKLLDK